jgi:glyoxylase-like metal-dependent hydrolase (beta-lactamase superfamily II)
MSSGVYSFTIGNLACAVVSDGTANLFPNAAEVLFQNAPADERDQALRSHGIAGLDIPYRANCLYIRTPDHQVLVDTGFGGGVHPDMGKLVENLRLMGVKPEDIDTLIITHAHGDHIQGVCDATGKLTFPNARHVMGKTEWDYWQGITDDPFMEAVLKIYLPAIKGRVELVADDAEIVPGVKLFAAPGHTPGHVGLSVTSDGAELLHIVDTVLDPIQIEHPDWVAMPDMLKDVVVTTRHQVLAHAAASGALVLTYHFAFPGLGHVLADGAGWKWAAGS